MRLNDRHYVPILKAKEGEYSSLRVLDSGVKELLTPVFELPPISWDFPNDRPGKSIDEHLKPTIGKIVQCWDQGRPAYLDPYWLPDTDTVADGRHLMTFLFDEARAQGLQLIPVTGLRRAAPYQAAITSVAKQDGRGVCIRLEEEDFDNPAQMAADLLSLLRVLRITPDTADLILDFRAIRPGSSGTIALAVGGVLSALPVINQWRNLIWTATAFPENMSGFTRESMTLTERTEWAVWLNLRGQQQTMPRFPIFGDYVIASPDPGEELDPRVIKMSANIRYAANDSWLIVKGHVLRSNENQYGALCQKLIARPEYSGTTFSWGDAYVNDCAGGADGPGNATTWRRVGTTHHLTHVVRQIASLP